MNENIDKVLQRLMNINFFARVGAPLNFLISSCSLVQVSSWEKAVDLRGSYAASDAFSEASGRLTGKLSMNFRPQYREWNRIARTNRELLEKELLPKIDASVDAIEALRSIEYGRELVKDFVRWDVVHFAAEQAYAELVEPEFYTSIIQIYEAGHFPCSWDEVWPNGRIWIC